MRHKLKEVTPEPQRLEDAVTSTVFGTLVHANAWEVLARWLRLPGDPAHLASGETDCWFWPRLSLAEPDVLLRIGDVLVAVEAKVQSLRHDTSTQGDEPTIGDQLLRQYRSIKTPGANRALYAEPIERAIRECELLQAYVVDGVRSYRRSAEQFEESKGRLPEGAAAVLVKWQRLTRFLGTGERWERDLKAYLINQRLDGFDGVGRWAAGPPAVSGIGLWRAGRPGLDWSLLLSLAPAVKTGPPWRVHGGKAFSGFQIDAVDAHLLKALLSWQRGGPKGQ